MDLYQIDVTGDDIFSKGYGIIVLYNNHPYAYKFASSIQYEIRDFGRKRLYGIRIDGRFKPRVYSTILYLILRRISLENDTSKRDFALHICNDFDGHQADIIERLRDLTKKEQIFDDITSTNFLFLRHHKKSLIQTLSLRLRAGDWTGISKVAIDRDLIHNALAKSSFRKNRW